MRIDFERRLASSGLACTLALLAGCAFQGTGRVDTGPEPVERGAATAAAAEPARTADTAAEVAAEAPAETVASRIDEILSERRRGDFPEVELEEFGFTVTEQVRIGGDARSDYERALGLLRQARYAEGISILEGVTESARDATVPYIDLGIAYELAGELERAEQALQTAAALSPDNPVVHNELGILYRKTGRFDDARESYEKALAVFADFHFARRNLAVLCDLYLADLECALQNYRAYLESVGSDSEVEIWVADLENRLSSQGGS